MFGLTAHEMEEEPIDELFTNLWISDQIAKKQEAESKWLNQNG